MGKRGGGGGGVKGQGRRNVSGPETEFYGQRKWRDEREEKDADIVVVDVSVLVHGISHLKKWCREGRQEVVIIPLEGQISSSLSRFYLTLSRRRFLTPCDLSM